MFAYYFKVALNASPVNSTHVTNLSHKKYKAGNILNATGNNNYLFTPGYKSYIVSHFL